MPDVNENNQLAADAAKTLKEFNIPLIITCIENEIAQDTGILEANLHLLFPKLVEEKERNKAWDEQKNKILQLLIEVKKQDAISLDKGIKLLDKKMLQLQDMKKHEKIDKKMLTAQDTKNIPSSLLNILSLPFQILQSFINNILMPIKLFISGITGLWDTYVIYRNEKLKETNLSLYAIKITSAVIDLAATIAVAVLLAATIAAPAIVLPAITLLSLFVGLIRQSAATHVSRIAVIKEKRSLAEAEQNLKAELSRNPRNLKKITDLKVAIKQSETHLAALRAARFQEKRNLVVSVLNVVAALLLIAAVAFPPSAAALAIAATVMFAAIALFEVIDRRLDNKFTRAISRWGSQLKKWWNSADEKTKDVVQKQEPKEERISSVIPSPSSKTTETKPHNSEVDILHEIFSTDPTAAAKKIAEALHRENHTDQSISRNAEKTAAPQKPFNAKEAKDDDKEGESPHLQK